MGNFGDWQSESDAIVEDIESGSAGRRILEKAKSLASKVGQSFVVFAGDVLPANAEYCTDDLNDAKRYARDSFDFWKMCGKGFGFVKIRSVKVPR
jgi:hypothetical protein